MSRRIHLFLLSLALLSLTAPAGATVIYVSGGQTGTWSADTVIVTGEVRVPPGQSLTILPGVEVLFSVYCKLIVDNGATLRAVGTPVDSIRFDVLPPNSQWHGIRFLSASDSSRLEYCLLTNGYASGSGEDDKGGAIYSSNSNPLISRCTLSDNSSDGGGGGIYCGNNSNPLLLDNSIIGNFAYPHGGAIYLINSNPLISGNSLGGNTAYESGGGIYCLYSDASILGNTLTGNFGNYYEGGGIYCWDANPTINGNIIQGNWCNLSGGGICCYSSSPDISGNVIFENYCVWGNGGGGIYCQGGVPTIRFNIISRNHSSSGSFGGGIYCFNNSPVIHDNVLSGNYADGCGGGMAFTGGSPQIECNMITHNRVFGHGGGIYLYNGSSVLIRGNVISANSTYDLFSHGGGIYLENCTATVSSNSIIANSVNQQYGNFGGGMYCNSLSTVVINCAFWGNSPEQICAYYGSPPQVTYSDIQGGWTGTGNINAYPAFVDTAHGDYRLQWGSPCIDTGDPNPLYNDPDSTRADMGAWYYDQSMPVRILLTPYDQPIQIPPAGGSFQYALHLTNIAASPLTVLGWCNVTLPYGVIYGPVLGPVRISLGSGQTINRVRTQNISAHAPAGIYHYNAFAAAMGDTSSDSFTFTKLGAGDLGLGAGDWTNTGESFDQAMAAEMIPNGFTLEKAHPNPFNPLTVISYQLSEDSYVELRVFDIGGRLVTVLVDGWREAGSHEVMFDGSGLASGVYVVRLDAGGQQASQKMVMMK